jgi:hypothetical protein
MVINQLGGQPPIALDEWFPNNLGNLIYLILFLRQLLFEQLKPGVHLFKFLQGRFVKRIAFPHPFID